MLQSTTASRRLVSYYMYPVHHAAVTDSQLGPFCNTPVAIPPGQDPNIRMERHIDSECTVATGKSGKSKSTPTCARAKCGKVLFSPIRCNVSICFAHVFWNV